MHQGTARLHFLLSEITLQHHILQLGTCRSELGVLSLLVAAEHLECRFLLRLKFLSLSRHGVVLNAQLVDTRLQCCHRPILLLLHDLAALLHLLDVLLHLHATLHHFIQI